MGDGDVGLLDDLRRLRRRLRGFRRFERGVPRVNHRGNGLLARFERGGKER